MKPQLVRATPLTAHDVIARAERHDREVVRALLFGLAVGIALGAALLVLLMRLRG